MKRVEPDEIEARAEALKKLLSPCRLCPRRCGADRLGGELGFCGVGEEALVSSYGPHHGEEACLRGWKGSGTIFLAGCNLGCVFCQNWEISRLRLGRPASAAELAAMMLDLERLGCHNINWVSPSHAAPQLVEALALARRRGLRLPVVYNTGGFDSVEALRLLEGVVDIYMPDFKFWSAEIARRLAGAPEYPEAARAAILEMRRQTGDLEIAPDGLASRGLLVRHLVLPGNLADSEQIFRWLAEEVSPRTAVNVMAQYRPAGEVSHLAGEPELGALARRLRSEEHAAALEAARKAGLRILED